MSLPAVGIFVGGRARRMAGAAKANLTFEGRSILERTLEACRVAAHRVSHAAALHIYLVGESSAYDAEGVLRLGDQPEGVGPLGGLRALLLEAARRGVEAVALAGDQPFLTPELLARLYREAPGAATLAPKQAGRWHPLFARYLPEHTLPEVDAALTEQQTSMQVIFERLGSRAMVLDLSSAERQALHDWDRPSDMLHGPRAG